MVSIESVRYYGSSYMFLSNKTIVFEKLVYILYMPLPSAVDDYGM